MRRGKKWPGGAAANNAPRKRVAVSGWGWGVQGPIVLASRTPQNSICTWFLRPASAPVSVLVLGPAVASRVKVLASV